MNACTRSLTLLLLVSGLRPPAVAAARPGEAWEPRILGLELEVHDVPRFAALLGQVGGFRSGGVEGGELSVLARADFRVVLRRSDGPAPRDTRIYLNLEVEDLDASCAAARRAGADEVGPAREVPIGTAATVACAGQRLDLIQPARPSPGAVRPAVRDVGLDLGGFAESEPFLEQLGFRVHSREHLPVALAYERAGAAGLVLHERADAPHDPAALGASLLLAVDELEGARTALAERGLELAHAPRSTALGRALSLTGPLGVTLQLVERTDAQLAFERLCALSGDWEGRSSAGWTSRTEFQVIARGSVVVERTHFEAHPGETMLTLFSLDEGQLVLTHYCVAGNQPELEATAIEADGARIEFTFRAAGNLASRDVGHMDAAVYRLDGADAFSSVWSWYQAGREQWMEEIHYRRTGAPAATAR
jgi:hypothetical protein